MHGDDELESWRRQWQAQPAVPTDLRGLVERDMQSRRREMWGAIVVTVVMGGGTLAWAARSGDANRYALAFVVWVFIVTAWMLTLQIERTRGPWRPLTDTTVAFLDYAIRARRARVQAITASVILYVVLSAFMLVWRYRAAATAAPLDPWTFLTSPPVLVFLAISGGLALLAIVQWRRLHRELTNLTSLRDAAPDDAR